jgi:putative endonuclease
MKEHFFVYILASERNGTLYIGLTSNLPKRIAEHKNGIIKGFTSKYNVKNLMHYEIFDDFDNAVKREKAMKAWKRAWKLELIEKHNPDWQDLYEEICA